jgi:SRSO17 transposase
MSILRSFQELLQNFSALMTRPTFDSLTSILSGWVFAVRRTVTGMIVAAGLVGTKHHSAFHRLFSQACWSLDQVGLMVLDLLTPFLGDTVSLALDDTLARKRGLKTFGVGMHHDPLSSSRKTKLFSWGHNWVVLGVLVRFPLWPERWFCLPILFRLYLNQKAAKRHRRVCWTRPQLAVELLKVVCNARKSLHFQVVADTTYGCQTVLKNLPANCDLTSRLGLDARLYDLPPAPKPHQRGRHAVRGRRRPTPEKMLTGRGRRLVLSIYGRRDTVRVTQTTAAVFAVPGRLLRIVAVEPLKGGRERQAFYSTCLDTTPEGLLTTYAARWSIEVAFHESKQHLGFEDPQNWTRSAVERTAPWAMLLYSLIVAWFVRTGHSSYEAPERPWYRTKRDASFADMLTTLRLCSFQDYISAIPLCDQDRNKLLEALKSAVIMAA